MEKNILTNRFCGVFVCALMLFATQVFAAWDGTSMEEPEIQEIEGKNFYLINDEAELAWFANETNKNPGARLNINAKLNADLDMNHKLWIPMAAGTGKVAFEGIIDGDGHVISNLYINSDEIAAVKKEFAQNLGFVGVLGNGSVKNIVFENVDIVTSTNAGSILSSKTNQISVGAVVGWLADKNPGGVVSACYVSGSIHATGDGQGIGGIVGNGKNGTIEHCLSAVTILAEGNDAFVCGIIGITKATLSVKSCVYDGEGLTNLGNGVTGAVVGNHISGALTTSNNYYDEDLSGIGNGSESGNTKVDLVNAEGIACALNDGEMLDGYCSVASPWSVGEKSLALNGYGAATISVLTVKETQYGAVTIKEYSDRTVAEIDGIERVRLGSLEPDHIKPVAQQLVNCPLRPASALPRRLVHREVQTSSSLQDTMRLPYQHPQPLARLREHGGRQQDDLELVVLERQFAAPPHLQHRLRIQ